MYSKRRKKLKYILMCTESATPIGVYYINNAVYSAGTRTSFVDESAMFGVLLSTLWVFWEKKDWRVNFCKK